MSKPTSPPPSLPNVQTVMALHDIGAQIRGARQRQALRIDGTAGLCGVSVDLLSRLNGPHTLLQQETAHG